MNILLSSFLNISLDSWIQLISGSAAVIVAYMAIIHSNKNSRKAIQQQNMILEYQHNEKKLEEYRKCLTDNMDLLNAVETYSPLISVSHIDYSQTKNEIVSRKAMIYTYDLRFRYLFESTDCTHIIVEYRKYWNLATAQLSLVLDTMMDYVNYLSGFALNMGILKDIRQQISIYERMIQVDSSNASSYLTEIAALQKDQSQLTEYLSHNKEEVDRYLESIKGKVDDMRTYTLDLHQLTMKVIAEKENQVKSLLESKM